MTKKTSFLLLIILFLGNIISLLHNSAASQKTSTLVKSGCEPGERKLNWTEAHNYCRMQGGFLPLDEDWNKIPITPAETEVWTALVNVAGHYQWLTRNPAFARHVSWDMGLKPEPWSSQCAIYNRQLKTYTSSECQRELNFCCIVDNVQEGDQSQEVELQISSNLPAKNNWIEVPKNSFSHLILTCTNNMFSSKDKDKVNRLQVHWKKDGIYLGQNGSTIYPATIDDPSKTSLFHWDSPESFTEASQQGTYCCETWAPNSTNTSISDCFLVTLSHITTLVISTVTDQHLSIQNISQLIGSVQNSQFANMSYAHIRSNKLGGKISKYEHKFLFHVQNIGGVANITVFFENYQLLSGGTKVNYSTYCSRTEIKNKSEFGVENSIDLPFAKAGHSYITNFKCKTEGNRLVYNVCSWNFTDGAWVSHLDRSTCIRYDVCPDGYTIVGGVLCVEIIKNVTWDEGYTRLYQTGNEATIFDDEFYFGKSSQTKKNLHNQVLDYLIARKVVNVWLPFKRKYRFTPLIDYSIRGFKKKRQNILPGKSIVISDWAENHPMGNKSCLAFDTTKSNLFTDECQKKFTFIKIVNIKELGLMSLQSYNESYHSASLCPFGWYRIALNADKYRCLKVFRDQLRSSWKEAKDFCTSKRATLVNPGKGFLNWALEVLLENNETAWTVVDKDVLQTSHFDYLNWLPETNFSKRYGIISKRGWSLVDDQEQISHLVICEKKTNSLYKPLKIWLEDFENVSVGVTRDICVRTEPTSYFRNQTVTCLKNGVVKELNCHKRQHCTCTLTLDQQGYYECFGWLECPLRQVWSPNFTNINPNLSMFVITGINTNTSYSPLNHDSTFIELKNLSKLDSPCIKAIYKQLSNEDKNVELTQILFSNNDSRLQFSFHLQCKKSISSYCKNIETVKEKIKAMISERKDCVILEVRNSVGCNEEITALLNGVNLTWQSTEGSGRFLSKELCIGENDLPANRLCEGNFFIGYIWSKAPHACSKETSELTKNIYVIYSDPQGYLNGKYATSLSKLTEDSELLTATDILFVASSVQNFTNNLSVSEKLGFSDVVSTINNIMGVKESVIATVDEQFNSISSLLVNFEKLLFLTLDKDISQINTDRISVGCIDLRKVSTVFGFQSGGRTSDSKVLLEGEDFDQNYISSFETAIVLPKDILRNKNITKLLFVVYKNANLFNDTSKGFKLASQVAQASFENVPVMNLENERVQVYFRPKYAVGNHTLECVFWDFKKNGKRGGWSQEGCKLIDSKDNLVTCECNHLTSFALLFNWNPSLTLSPIHVYYLGFISTIGCSLSIFGTVLVLVTFFLFEDFRSNNRKPDNKILANLAFAILMSMLIFLTGIQQTWNAPLCRAVAVSLHYFILASFCWMLVESIHQYNKFVRVLGGYIPRFIWKAFVFSWGMPFIPIIVVLTVDSDLYFKDDVRGICWMKSNAFLYSFVPPVAIILSINLVLFGIIINRTIISGNLMQSNQDPKKLIISQMSMAICVFFLLGITWIFGFFSFSAETVTFAYLFCIFNASQGFFIFFFHIYRNEKARNVWIKFFKGDRKRYSRQQLTNQNTSMTDNFKTLSKRQRKQSDNIPL